MNRELILEERSYAGALRRVCLAAPSWLGSALLHFVVLLVFCQIQWHGVTAPATPAVVDLKPKVDAGKAPTDLDGARMPEPPPVQTAQAWGRPAEWTPVPDGKGTGEPGTDDVDVTGNAAIDLPGGDGGLIDDSVPRIEVAGLGGTRSGLGPGDGRPGPYELRRLKKSGPGWTGWPPAARVDPALEWLARAQEKDGHWDSQRWGANHNCDAAVTGLAIMAFLSNGETDREGTHKKNVSNALKWLEARQSADGGFGERFYTQGICTMAIAQAYGMTQNAQWRTPAQKALNFCCANQNPYGGWDYLGNNPARVDTSVTAWMVLALKSGVSSGLTVPQASIDQVKRWLAESVNADGTTGYTKNIGTQGSSAGSPAMTAAATLCRQFMGWLPGDPEVTRGLDYMQKSGVQLDNLYYTYYASLAMFQVSRLHSDYWLSWRRGFGEPLLARQVKNMGAEFDGSWNPDTTYGPHGGRVYTTAMAVFCLSAEYIYLPMLK